MIYGIGVQIDPKLKELMEGLKLVDSVVKETAWTETQKLALGEEKMIKDEMPVDTGRAKASWGHFTADDLAAGASRMGKGTRITKRTKFMTGKGLNSERIQIASAGDAIWIEDKSNLSITQGTQVPYTTYLNDGHSAQAAAFFIDRAEQWANNQIEKFSDAVFAMVSKVLENR